MLPLIKIDFGLALKITHPEMQMSNLGLVTIAVDSSIIRARWILSQITEKGELPVLFGSVTFKEHKSRYLQPKLELYSLYCALKAQCHMYKHSQFSPFQKSQGLNWCCLNYLPTCKYCIGFILIQLWGDLLSYPSSS